MDEKQQGRQLCDDAAGTLRKIVMERLGVDATDVTDDAGFIDDLGVDSLDVVQLILALEVEFGCEMSDAAVEKIVTVKDAINFVEAHKAKGGVTAAAA